MTDLDAYAPLSERVAALGEDDDLLIEASAFGDLAEITSFRDIILDNTFCRSIGWTGPGEDRPYEISDRTNGFAAYVEAEALRRIGLWMLHLLFSGRAWAGLALTHPTSRIKHLYVEIDRPEPSTFLKTEGDIRYTAYEHWPLEASRHPFAETAMAGGPRVQPEDRPLFALGWSTRQTDMRPDPTKADQLILAMTPAGLCAMASLFFDMGHKTLGHNEVDMEPPVVGFAATQPRSIEARFWLPGSLGFYADTLDEITLPPVPED
jgi:hypothetical protein